nr:hypothetical protein [Planotetraspora silvatica]
MSDHRVEMVVVHRDEQVKRQLAVEDVGELFQQFLAMSRSAVEVGEKFFDLIDRGHDRDRITGGITFDRPSAKEGGDGQTGEGRGRLVRGP